MLRKPKYPAGGPWKMREVVREVHAYGQGRTETTMYLLKCGHIRTLVGWRRWPGQRTRCYECGSGR